MPSVQVQLWPIRKNPKNNDPLWSYILYTMSYLVLYVTFYPILAIEGSDAPCVWSWLNTWILLIDCPSIIPSLHILSRKNFRPAKERKGSLQLETHLNSYSLNLKECRDKPIWKKILKNMIINLGYLSVFFMQIVFNTSSANLIKFISQLS